MFKIDDLLKAQIDKVLKNLGLKSLVLCGDRTYGGCAACSGQCDGDCMYSCYAGCGKEARL